MFPTRRDLLRPCAGFAYHPTFLILLDELNGDTCRTRQDVCRALAMSQPFRGCSGRPLPQREHSLFPTRWQ